MYYRKNRKGKENKAQDYQNQVQLTQNPDQKWDPLKNDYLYKVARIQENCMLRQKHQNQFTYGERIEEQTNKKSFQIIDEEEDEVYLDLGFTSTENKKKRIGILAFEDSDSDKKIENEGNKQQRKKEEANKIFYLDDSSEDDRDNQHRKQDEDHTQERDKEKQKEQENDEPDQFLEIKKEEIWNFQGFSDNDPDQQKVEETQNKQQSQNEVRQSKSSNHSNESSFNSESSTSSKQQIKGVKLTTNPLQGNVTISIVNKKQFIMSPIPPGIIIKCVLRRSSGFLNPFTQFDLFLHNGLKHFVSAKRFPLASTEIFKMSTSTEIYDEGFYVGSLMANTVHSHYWLVSSKESKQKEFEHGRLQTFIEYDEKIPKKGERGLRIYICDKEQKALVSMKNQNLDPKIIKNRKHLELFNKPRNEQMASSDKGESLDSIKRVCIIDKEDEEYEYISMDKVSKDMFHVQIQHPFTPLQAFAFILTRFDAQLK